MQFAPALLVVILDRTDPSHVHLGRFKWVAVAFPCGFIESDRTFIEFLRSSFKSHVGHIFADAESFGVFLC